MSGETQYTELKPPPNGAGAPEQQIREILDWAHEYHRRLDQVVRDLMQRLENISAVSPATADAIVEAAQTTIEE